MRMSRWAGAVLLALYAIAAQLQLAQAGAVELRAVSAFPKNDDIQNRGFILFLERLDQKGQGRVRINWVGGPETIPPFELHEAIRRGVVDVVWISTSYYVPTLPEVSVLAFSEISLREERESGALDYLNQIHQRKLNVFWLGRGGGHVGFSVYTTRPLRSVADFRGRRIRVAPVYIPFMQALGASPVLMPAGEIYTALERGVVEGFTWPDVGIRLLKLDEVVRYKLYPTFWQVDISSLVNLDKWRSLPSDVQQVMVESAREVEQELAPVYRQIIEEENRALRARGIEFVTLQGDEARRYLELARESAWQFIRQNVKEDPERLISYFSRGS